MAATLASASANPSRSPLNFAAARVLAAAYSAISRARSPASSGVMVFKVAMSVIWHGAMRSQTAVNPVNAVCYNQTDPLPIFEVVCINAPPIHQGVAMRTNIEVDDKLMKQALRLTGYKTKRAVVEAGLQMLVRVKGQEEILKLRGKVHWEGNIDDFNNRTDP
jgi:Arc/MetJ family transcription regulator